MAKFFDHIAGFVISTSNSPAETQLLLQERDRPALKVGETDYGYLVTTNTSTNSNQLQTIYGALKLQYDRDHSLIHNAGGTSIIGGASISGGVDMHDGVTIDILNGRNLTHFWQAETENPVVAEAQHATSATKIDKPSIYYWADIPLQSYSRTDESPTFSQCHATTFFATSDKRLKENIKNYTSGLDIINKIEVKSYNWIKDKDKQQNIGCIAQELQSILPDELKGFFISENGDGYLSVNDSKLIYFLINAVKELQKQINELRK